MDAVNFEAQACDEPAQAQPVVARSTRGRTDDVRCRPIRILPLFLVLAGTVLTVLGHMVRLEYCKILGPVTVALGGMSLFVITIWVSRQRELKERSANSSESVVSSFDIYSRQGQTSALPPYSTIASYTNETVPPSYDEVVNSADLSSIPPPRYSQSNEPDIGNIPSSAEPPSYEDIMAHQTNSSFNDAVSDSSEVNVRTDSALA